MKITKEQILEKIYSMSVLEIVDLINDIERKFNITADTYTNFNQKEVSPVEIKTEYDCYLQNIGTNKIAVIKVVRSYLNIGLKEAKDLVESAPVLIKAKISKKEIDILQKSLLEVGAVVEIK